jgi:hypothetical protein
MLGEPFLFENNVERNYGKCVAYITLQVKPTKTWVRRVILAKNVDLAPKSEYIVPMDVQFNGPIKPSTTDWATDAVEPIGGICIARTVIPNRSMNVPARLVNINDKPVHLPEGTSLAVLQEVEIPSDPRAATFDVEQRPPPWDGLLHQQPHTTTETDSHVDAIIADLISKVDPSIPDEFKTRLYHHQNQMNPCQSQKRKEMSLVGLHEACSFSRVFFVTLTFT